MKIKKNFLIRKVGNEHVVLSTDGSFNGMIKLNAVAADLWTFFEMDNSKEEAIDHLCANYEVERDRASKDVSDFISLLEKNGFLDA